MAGAIFPIHNGVLESDLELAGHNLTQSGVPISLGGGVWGGITGTLSAQTDLQTALNGKMAVNGNTTGSAGSLALPGGGSVTGAAGAVSIAAGGTNQNITLAPSGTGIVAMKGGYFENPIYLFATLADAAAKNYVQAFLAYDSNLGGAYLGNNMGVSWSPNAGLSSFTKDTGLSRNAAGVVEINNGTPGTYRDLIARNVLANTVAPCNQLYVFDTIAHAQAADYSSSSMALDGNLGGVYLRSDYGVNWATTTDLHLFTKDTGLYRNAAGVLEINNGTQGTYRDLILRKLIVPEPGGIPNVIEANSGGYLTFNRAGNGPTFAFYGGDGRVHTAAGGWFGWTSDPVNAAQTADLMLVRDAANTLAQRNGTNAQIFNLYQTYTSGSNYARWQFYVGSGFMQFGYDSVGGSAGVGHLYLGGGDSGYIYFRTREGIGNSIVRWKMTSSDVGVGEGHLLAGADNTYDIGAASARPRDVNVARNVVAGGSVNGQNFNLSDAGYLQTATRANMSSPADGVWLMQNAATTSFNRLQLGGTSSSFPAIKRNGAGIDLRLADDSAYANLAAAGLTLSGAITLGNGSVNNATAVSITAGGNLTVASGFTLYGPSDGVLRLTDTAGTSFGRLQLGGTTSSFPAIKRNGAGIDIRLADDSAYANLATGTLTVTGNLLPAATATYDIGGISNLVFRVFTQYLKLNNSSVITAPSDGIIELLNDAGTSFNRLQFGGTTSSFPSIKRNGTAINFRLADDSDWAEITAGDIGYAAGKAIYPRERLAAGDWFLGHYSSAGYDNCAGTGGGPFRFGTGSGVTAFTSAVEIDVTGGIGAIKVKGATSGTSTLKATAVAGTNTQTLPAETGDIYIGNKQKTVLGSSAASITFTVPSGYTNLRLIIQARGDNAVTIGGVMMRFNSDTGSNYDWEQVYTVSVNSPTTYNQQGVTSMQVCTYVGSSGLTNRCSQAQAVIANYAGTTFNKTMTSVISDFADNSNAGIRSVGGNWRSTSAITSITLFPDSGNFIAGTTVTLIAE